MCKRILFDTYVFVVVVVIIFTVALVSSYPQETSVRPTHKEYEYEGGMADSNSTTSRDETTTKMDTSTSTELGEQETVGGTIKGNEEVSSTVTLSSTTSKIETHTETYEDGIAAGDYIGLSVKCLRKSGISFFNLRSLSYGFISNDESVKEYLLCTLKGMGIMDRTGNFSVNASRLKSLSKQIKDDDVEKFIDVCKNEIRQTPGDTAILVYKCMLKNNL